MDRFAELNAFALVARTGGFSSAARQLGMATSSVTRLVDALEQRIGTPLLNRSTRNVTLTDSGLAYFERALAILEQLEAADEEASVDNHEPRGVLRVTAPVTFSTLYVAPLLKEFTQRHPRVKLDLQLSDALTNLVEESIDVAIRIGNCDNQPNLIARCLTGHERIICASPEYLSRFGTPRAPSELLQHNCLQFAYGKSGRTGWQLKGPGTVEEISVSGNLVANNSEMLRRATLDGLGIAMLPDWLVRKDLHAGTLHRILADHVANPGPMDVGLYALYPINRRGSVKVKAFIELLAEHLAAGLHQ